MGDLVIATRNQHKTREIAQMLGAAWRVSDLSGRDDLPQIEESGETFYENARIKAVEISRVLPGLILADDSGLAVDALGGAPGVRSARFAGMDANDASNRQELLARLGVLKTQRVLHEPITARFECAMVIAHDGRELFASTGRIEGVITLEPRGANGFGYDPLFIPSGESRTLAEFSAEEKNAISHRARALADVMKFLAAL